MLLVGFVEKAAAGEIQIIDFRDGRRVALQDDIFDAEVAAANEAGARAEFVILNARRRRSGNDVRQDSDAIGPFRL